MKYSLTIMILIAFLINISPDCYCSEQIGLYLYNDANRSIMGRGCWTGEPFYYKCEWPSHIPDDFEGYFGTGEAWLWAFTGETEVNSIDVTCILFDSSSYGINQCPMYDFGAGFWCNNEIVQGEYLTYVDQMCLEDCRCNGRLLLKECQKGWFLLGRFVVVRVGGWSILVGGLGSGTFATLCDENSSIIPINGAGFTLDPVTIDEWDYPVTSNDNSSWGSIKSLYR